ncbi:MAG: PD-(D/E)XK nuclease family protein [Bacteroidota bacterium]
MSRAILLSPSLNLIDEVISCIDSDGGDFRNILIVFPGKRPAHFLRKALAEKLGKAYLPPLIFSIDNFIEWAHREKLGGMTANLDSIDAIALLYEIYSDDKAQLSAHQDGSLEEFLPMGMGIFNEIEELRLARVTPNRVREIATIEPGYKGGKQLALYYQRFYELVSDRKLSTRASMYVDVGNELTADALLEFKQIIIAGFSALTEAERMLFTSLKQIDRCTFLFQDGPHIEKHLRSLKIKHDRKESQTTEPEISFAMAPDGHGEVYALSSEINKLIQGESPLDEKTVIVLPDAVNLFPVINETLALVQDEDYNISLGYPVTRTPVFAFLNNIMDAVSSMYKGQVYAPDYFKLVLHPYAKNIRIGNRSDITRILFHTIEEEYAGDKSKMFFSLESIEESEILNIALARMIQAGIQATYPDLHSHLITIHNNLIRAFMAIGNLGDFADKCITVLNYVHDNSTANLHIYFRRFVEIIIKSLHGISTSLLKNITLAEPVSYCTVIRKFFHTVRIPFEGTPLHGLQVLGFLETRNLQFKRVFILDANDDVLPGTKGHDMLLPQKARELLGLPTYRDREELTAYYFDLLVRGSNEVHCYYVQNDKKEKSRYLEKLIWEKQRAAGTVEIEKFIGGVDYRVSLINEIPANIPKTDAIARHLRNYCFNSSAFDRYLHCQLKFYYTDVLKLREKEDAASDIESRDIGTLVHSVLAKYFASRKGVRLTKENLDDRDMKKTIDEEFSWQFGNEPAGMKFLLKDQIKIQLSRFLEKYQLPQAVNANIVILDVEKKVKTTKDSFTFDGFIDRLEKRGDNYFILDYKTGSSGNRYKIKFKKLVPEDRETWNDAIGSLQLPLYVLLYANETGLPPEKIIPAYLLLGKNDLSPDIEISLGEDENDRKNIYAMFETIIFKLVNEIVNPDISFIPPKNLKKACPNCPFTYMCGTQWVQGWKGE